MNLLCVAIGGAIGASCRYLMGVLFTHFDTSQINLPICTLCINIIGCFMIGLLFEVFSSSHYSSEKLYHLCVTGLTGGFTTLAAFGHETITLMTAGKLLAAGVYSFLTFGCCLLFVYLGRTLAKTIL